MQTPIGILTSLGHRPGVVGIIALGLFVVALALAVGLSFGFAGELAVTGADPVQVAPVRWWHRA